MDRKALAQETRRIVEQGYYVAGNVRADIAAQIEAARQGTRLYRPDEIQRLLDLPNVSGGNAPRPEVTAESTGEAACRLVREGIDDVVALNFASARNPGGGWLGGARAQEEDLSICSALVATLWTKPDFYDANRRESSLLYTDHLIHSPRVPFIRDEEKNLSSPPLAVSVITAPAPNAGEHLRRHPDDHDGVRRTLRRRSGQILAAARDRGHRTLVLGAWGCGVFRNNPADVAACFKAWLADARFAGAFDRVVFAILDRSGSTSTLSAFQQAFPA
jgi:uncharacterized protein (TIGR02452 family)